MTTYATWERDPSISNGDLEAQINTRELDALADLVANPDSVPPHQLRALEVRDQRRVALVQEQKALREIASTVLPRPYNEIKNLLWIENNVIYRKALQDWERKGQLLTARVERKKKRIGNLRNEVYQLIGFFSVFQGVVLTAVSQSNLLHCNNLWCPIVLSGLASVVTIAGVRQKLSNITALEETIFKEETSLREVVHRETNLRRLGEKFRFINFYEDSRTVDASKQKQGPSKYNILVQLTLILFMVAFALSHWRILCHSDPAPHPT